MKSNALESDFDTEYNGSDIVVITGVFEVGNRFVRHTIRHSMIEVLFSAVTLNHTAVSLVIHEAFLRNGFCHITLAK